MNDVLIAAIRRVVASLAGGAIVWLAATLHLVVDDDTSRVVIGFAVLVAVAVYGWVAQQLEQRYPWLGMILFLGASRQVTYRKHTG